MRSDVLLRGGTRAGTFVHDTGIWMFLIGVPVAGLLAAVLWSTKAYFAHGGAAFLKFGMGAAIFFLGALGGDFLNNLPVPGSFGYSLSVLGEELAEMVGATFVLWAAYGLAAPQLVLARSILSEKCDG